MKINRASHSPDQQSIRLIDWSPYLCGIGIGILSWVAFGLAHDPLGVTTAYSRVASLFALPILGSEGVARNSYWKTMPLSFDYGVIFLGGLMLGSFFSALFAGGLRIETMHSNWRERFGGSVAKRLAVAFFGGTILMYGARLAGGCSSGHAISGGLQLALSSWVFLIVMFASGLAISALIYGFGEGGRA